MKTILKQNLNSKISTILEQSEYVLAVEESVYNNGIHVDIVGANTRHQISWLHKFGIQKNM